MLLRRAATTEPVTNFGYPAKYTVTKWVGPTATARGRRTQRARERERRCKKRLKNKVTRKVVTSIGEQS